MQLRGLWEEPLGTLSHLNPLSPCLTPGFHPTASRTDLCILLLQSALSLGALGWGFNSILFTDCRHRACARPSRKCLNEVFGPSSSMPGQRKLKPEQNSLICTKCLRLTSFEGHSQQFRICRLP